MPIGAGAGRLREEPNRGAVRPGLKRQPDWDAATFHRTPWRGVRGKPELAVPCGLRCIPPDSASSTTPPTAPRDDASVTTALGDPSTPARGEVVTNMRAVVHDTYGPPEVLRLDEVERPAPKEDERPGQSPRHDRHAVRLRLAEAASLLLPCVHGPPTPEVPDSGDGVCGRGRGGRLCRSRVRGRRPRLRCQELRRQRRVRLHPREARAGAHAGRLHLRGGGSGRATEAASRSSAYVVPATSMGRASLSTAPLAPSGRRPSSSRNTSART